MRTAQPGKVRRTGITTGSCAALAAKAAARMLLAGKAEPETESSITTPNGTRLAAPLHAVTVTPDTARCAVQKDAGDDPDITDGVLVFATVRRAETGGIAIDGGEGVGRVTRPGLDQPVGAAAINSTPRRMIEEAVREACGESGYNPDNGNGLSVTISIPGGEGLAARTFNPRLGIAGGLSVIGTTGIVEPMSTRAVVDTLRVELNVLRAEGATAVILTPGNYGETFLRAHPEIALRPCVTCANFMGVALDAATELGFEAILLVGHIGKLIKLAGGVMNTHSDTADCRLELLALGAALHGADTAAVRKILEATTVDDGLTVLGDTDTRRAVAATLLERAEAYCARRIGENSASPRIGLVTFSHHFGLLAISAGAEKILHRWKEKKTRVTK